MSEEMESEALREVRCRREEREAARQESPSDWDLVEEAVEKKDWEVVRWVLRQGGIRSVDKRRGADGKTLLHDACHGGDLETVKMLCQEMGADVEKEDGWREWNAVLFACDGGHTDVLRYLLTEGGAEGGAWRSCSGGECPLHVGAHSLPVVRCLVEEFGVDVNEENFARQETPLHRAARAGNVSCLRYLLERGARLDAETEDGSEGVLLSAVQAESGDALRFLVEECGCDPSALEEVKQGYLLRGAASSSLECLQYLVEECGLSLIVDERSGAFLLRSAVGAGVVEVAEYLVQHHGVNPEEADRSSGRRLLHIAAHDGHLSMVKWLVQQCGLDVEAANSGGQRAVHLAVSDLPILRFLVEEGADVNAQTNEKYTALHMAASAGRMDCVRYLVEEADADVLLEDGEGERPSQMAAGWGRKEMAAFLQETEEMAQMRKNPE